jgi:hypothetical protein
MTDNDDAGEQSQSEGEESGASTEDEVIGMYGSPAPEDAEDTDESESAEPAPEDDDAGSDTSFPGPLGDTDEKEEMETETGRFYVKHTEDVAVTLHEVNTGQIFTLVENPDLEVHQILDATLMENPPLGVSYVIDELHSQETIPVEYSDEPPTGQVQKIATDMDTDQVVAIEREGEGEIHVLNVDPERTSEAAEPLEEDETTYKNAARYGVERVEIRTDEDAGVVSIRYLP